jgi:peptide/nickel transport system substrate-binding protein
MKTKRWFVAVALFVIATLVLGACAPAEKTPEPAPTEEEIAPTEEEEEGRMTEQGTPRHETLIMDHLDGRVDNPTQLNPYMPGTKFNQGFHQVCISHLWDLNTVTGKQFPTVAAEMAEALNDDYTKFRIKLREGIYWSDGVEFTADDIAFTIDMVLSTPELPYNGFLSTVIKDWDVVDKHTIEIETVDPYPRIETVLGAHIWGGGFRPVPKHVWENEDPTTFENYPPVCLGPYFLADVDPNGYWFLWERREDWERTDVGMVVGEPKPQYLLVKFYGPEEKRIIAMIQHDLDILNDIVPESWDVLREKNEYARAWHDSFPWADFDDPCERGITFNNSEPPYDKWEVRWALALATDIETVAMGTFAGMLRVSPLEVPPVYILQETYHKPMVPWLKEFALPDGYKPFDPDYSIRMAELFRSQGVEGLPTDEQEIRDLFGVGWWKYDTEEAAKLLESVDFTRDADGNWLLPDGEPWQITIAAPADFEVESGRLAYAVADSWRKFGIDATVQAMEGGTFWNSATLGTYDAGSYWPGCGAGPDVYPQMRGWHKKFIVPTGEPAPGNANRHDSDKISAILDEMAFTPDEPGNTELTTELMKAFVEEMPWIQMFGTSKFVPVDTYYWDNFPTADNFYEGPWWWWSNFKFIMAHFEPTGRK